MGKGGKIDWVFVARPSPAPERTMADACSTAIETEKSRRCFILVTTRAACARGGRTGGAAERKSRNHEQVQGTRHHVARINDSRPRRRYEARKHFPFFPPSAPLGLPLCCAGLAGEVMFAEEDRPARSRPLQEAGNYRCRTAGAHSRVAGRFICNAIGRFVDLNG